MKRGANGEKAGGMSASAAIVGVAAKMVNQHKW
jgi:hypothetical protein